MSSRPCRGRAIAFCRDVSLVAPAPRRPSGCTACSLLRPRAATSPTPSVWRATLPLVAGAFLALTGWSWLRSTPPAPLALTDLVQLTSGIGFEADPSISADGRRIAFTAEEKGFNEIYVRPVGDGNRIQVTTDGGQNVESVWSPDGESIAYHSQAKGGIWIVPASGGPSKQVATLGSEPAWSPDGSTVGVLDLPGRSCRAGNDHERSGRGRRRAGRSRARVRRGAGIEAPRGPTMAAASRSTPSTVVREGRSGSSPRLAARPRASPWPPRRIASPSRPTTARCAGAGWARQRTSGSGA